MDQEGGIKRRLRLGDATKRHLKVVAYSAGIGVASKFVSFVGLTYLALLVTNDTYGLFSILQLLITGISSIASSSLAFAANKSASLLREDPRSFTVPEMVAIIFRSKARMFGAVMLLTVVLIPVLFTILSGGRFTPFLILVGLLSPVIVFADALVGALAGFGRFRAAALVEGGRAVTSGAGVLLLGLTLGYIGAGFGLFLLDVVIVIGIVIVVRLQRNNSATHGVAPEEKSAVVGSGIASNLLAQIGNWVLYGLIQATFGLGGVAALGVANRFAALVLLAPTYIIKNFLGELNASYARKDPIESLRLIRSYIVIVGVLAIGAAIAAFAIMEIFFGDLADRYDNLHMIMVVLLAAAVLRAVSTALGVVCVSREMFRTWVISDAIALVALLVACAITIPTGAGLAVVLCGMVFANLTCVIFRQWRLHVDITRTDRIAERAT